MEVGYHDCCILRFVPLVSSPVDPEVLIPRTTKRSGTIIFLLDEAETEPRKGRHQDNIGALPKGKVCKWMAGLHTVSNVQDYSLLRCHLSGW